MKIELTFLAYSYTAGNMKTLPPLNGLRAFDASGRTLTFRAASEELGVTQGAIAQQVRGLEEYLNISLFERHSKGLAFTASGRSYHSRIQSAFSEIREATENLRPEPGKVVISVTPTFASKWLIPNLPDFTAKHPNIDLRIMATERVSSFHSDGTNLAVRQGNPPFGASIDPYLLFKQEIIAVASKSLLDGAEVPLSSEVLKSLPKIHDTHDLWPRFMSKLNLEDKSGRGLRLSQTALSIDAAVAGQGIALASRFLVVNDIVDQNLMQVVPETLSGTGDFYLLARRTDVHQPALRSVIDWMKQLAIGG